jgi:hypothetical protein
VRKHIEARADPARHELRDERRLVDDLAARRIDQARTIFEQRKPPSVDEAARFRRQRRVDRQDVGLAEQLVQLAVLAETRVAAVPLRIEHP